LRKPGNSRREPPQEFELHIKMLAGEDEQQRPPDVIEPAKSEEVYLGLFSY
jgi:hypothetical protein